MSSQNRKQTQTRDPLHRTRSHSTLLPPHNHQVHDITHLLAYIDSVVDAQEQRTPVPKPNLPRSRSQSCSTNLHLNVTPRSSSTLHTYNTHQFALSKSTPEIVNNHPQPKPAMLSPQYTQSTQSAHDRRDYSASPHPHYATPDSPRSVSSSSMDVLDADSYNNLLLHRILPGTADKNGTYHKNGTSPSKSPLFQYPESEQMRAHNVANTATANMVNMKFSDYESKSAEMTSTKPRFTNKLTTVHSCGGLEMDDDEVQEAMANFDELEAMREASEISTINEEDNEDDMNFIVDARCNEECQQLMFLYNSKSGGQHGGLLAAYFMAYTPLIYDLLKLNSSQQEIERLAADLVTYEDKLVISIVGGDGSQAWGCSLIDKALQSATKAVNFPTIVPFPVGTGNDLSRSLGWGCLERTPDKIIKHVADVEYCFNVSKRFSTLDRWGCTYTFPHIHKQWQKHKQRDTKPQPSLDYKAETESLTQTEPEEESNKENEPGREHDGDSKHEPHEHEQEEEEKEIKHNDEDSTHDKFQSEEAMLNGYINNTFSPPLPRQFMCYLSFGYDAMITYQFAEERKNNPQKFKSQTSNQHVYLKLGIRELVSPSSPVNESVELEIDGKTTTIPPNTRSLKLVNINSAANGIFFWGYKKSRKDELQTWKRPELNDGLIEVMATGGSADFALAKTHLTHARRLGQSNDIKMTVVKPPVYLQIDGEGWLIEKRCSLHIKLHDQLPTLVGYKYPRGVYHKYEAGHYNDKIKKARHRYREFIRSKYNIPKKVSIAQPAGLGKRKKSQDDFEINMKRNGFRHDDRESKEDESENLQHAATETKVKNGKNSYLSSLAVANKKHRRAQSTSSLHSYFRPVANGSAMPKLDEMMQSKENENVKTKKRTSRKKWRLSFSMAEEDTNATEKNK